MSAINLINKIAQIGTILLHGILYGFPSYLDCINLCYLFYIDLNVIEQIESLRSTKFIIIIKNNIHAHVYF
jgi:hypothetical protein